MKLCNWLSTFIHFPFFPLFFLFDIKEEVLFTLNLFSSKHIDIFLFISLLSSSFDCERVVYSTEASTHRLPITIPKLAKEKPARTNSATGSKRV